MQAISDQVIREEALNPAYSFIVQAPAGSGKTTLLMQRFLVLLSFVKVPEECLAITFTRKAAHEMRDRILSALIKAKNLNPPLDPQEYKTWNLARQVLERDQTLGWNLLLNPNRLKIQTIDALCTSLTRGMPVVSGLGILPEIEEKAYPLYEAAACYLLEAIETNDAWSEALRFLVLHLDNDLDLLKRLLANLLQKRDQWLPYIGKTYSVEDSRSLLEQGLHCAIQDALFRVKALIPTGMEKLLDLAQFSAKTLGQDFLEEWPGINVKDFSHWLKLAELLLTEEGTLRKTVTQKQGFPAPSSAGNKIDKILYQTMKNDMIEVLNRLEDSFEFLNALRYVKECPPPFYSENQWQIVEALIKLLPVLSAQLTVIFQEWDQVDFTEISLRASLALGELDVPSDLALGLDYKIQHILVDEFQDTSLSQFRLLEQLTTGWEKGDGRTLFLVGDPKQSIYRFRQAEVGLFIAVKEQGINGLPIKLLDLTVNFRSDPTLVHWLNDVFSKSFPKKEDIVSGAICFSACKAARSHEMNSEILVHFVSEEESEAESVVDLIERARARDPNGSIAILVRSRTHLVDILPQLRKREITYQGVDLDLLSHRPVIQDLLALTRALLHLGDRIAWVALLRFPWHGLSLKDLLVLTKEAKDLPLWYSLSRYLELGDLSVEGKEKLAHSVPILEKALEDQGRLSLRTWVTETWIALQGHQYLYDDHSLQDAEAFFEVLDQLEKIGGFEEPGVLEKQVQSLYSKTTVLDPKSVQIMTIHKAKGLEFDTVILPGLGRRPKGEESQLLLWEERRTREGQDYLIFAPIKPIGVEEDPVYAYLKKEKQRSAEYEALRLLYVAATRARKRLYCITHKPEARSLLSLIPNFEELYTIIDKNESVSF